MTWCLPTTVIKVSVLSAHDKGSHAEVQVKVRKVLHSGRAALSLGTISVYPLSWTSRGCTCPLLNPGKMYQNNRVIIHFVLIWWGRVLSINWIFLAFHLQWGRCLNWLAVSTRCGLPACRSRGGWDRTPAGHHAECGGSLDTQTRLTSVRRSAEWMSMNCVSLTGKTPSCCTGTAVHTRDWKMLDSV